MPPRNGEKRPGGTLRDGDESPASGRRDPSQAIAHAINNPLAALIANLELVAEAVDGEPSAFLSRVDDTRLSLREAQQSAERIRSIVSNLQAGRTPDDEARAADEFEPTEPITASRSHWTKILVVDDETAIGRVLAQTLGGCDVVVLESATDALARIVAGNRFDLILCDLMMSEMTGMDLYEEVVRRAPEQAPSFVFLTGGAVTTRARDFVRTVPNLVLHKPFDVQKIRDLVRAREQRSDRVVCVVDDDADTRKMIVHWLTRARFTCIEQPSGDSVVQALTSDPDAVDAVVLDVMMPGMDGFDVLARLKENPATAHIPIVMLTAHAVAESDVARGIDAGASFYLAKPFAGPVLVAQVRAACERSDAERELRMRLHFAEEHATTDALTGLMNRRAFEGRLAEGVANTARHREPLTLVMLDIDHFKTFNDTFGHAGGDRILLYFARALRRAIRTGDQAFRYGGEEFALLLPRCEVHGALSVVERIRRDLSDRPVSMVEGKTEVVRFSAGVASAHDGNAFRVEDLVTRADSALYKAKTAGRDRIESED